MITRLQCPTCGDVLSLEIEETQACSCGNIRLEDSSAQGMKLYIGEETIQLLQQQEDDTLACRTIRSKPQKVLIQNRQEKRRRDYEAFLKKIKEKYEI